jgi:hypothetical protein
VSQMDNSGCEGTDFIQGDCQEFRARPGMMGAKEPAHAETQRAAYS